MKNRRTLALRRESLTELGTDELTVVAGAAAQLPPWTPVIHTLPLDRCVVLVSFDCVVTLDVSCTTR